MRSRLPRALVLAAALACAPAGQALAQDVDLRELDNPGGGFPTSTAAAPLSTPEGGTLAASPRAADDESPVATPQPQDTEEDRSAPNYGKPRKMKAKLYKPNPKTSPPLSPLVPYRGAPGPQRKVLNPKPPPKDEIDAAQPAPSVAVIASPPLPKKPIVEVDPFAPTGVQVGELRLLPFVETSAGYESNPNQVPTGIKPSPALRVDGGVDVNSDFSNNSLTASLRGGYTEFPANTDASRPDASGTVDGRIDVTRDDQINLEGRFSLQTQTPSSTVLVGVNNATVTNRPLIGSEGATVGATHTFNRLSVGLRTTFDRTEYGDATQSDGTIIKYSQDNFNDIGLIGRAAYEVTPAIIPFGEVGVDDRIRDNPADLSGYYRDSIGGFARAGTTLEMAHLLTGTISAGYLQRHYADPRLTDLKGPTLDAALVYAPTPLTTVTFRSVTTASETTLPGATGAISRQFSIEVGHTFFRNFTVTGIATYQPNDYQGISVNEHYTQFTLKGAYSISREIQLIGSASRSQLSSTLSYNNYIDNVFLLGVRLQR